MNSQNQSVIVKPSEIPGLDLTSLVALPPLAQPQPTPPEPPEPASAGSTTKPPRKAKQVKRAVTDQPSAPNAKTATDGDNVTAAMAEEFESCLKKFKLGLGSVAETLATIYDKGLFKAKYRTWAKFVEVECPYGLAYADRLRQANGILNSPTLVGVAKPANIAQAIALGAAPEAKYGEVMAKATELAGTDKPTAKHIAEAVQVVAPRPKVPANARGGGEPVEPANAHTQPPIKAADALGWLATVSANLGDPAKVESSRELLELIRLALESYARAAAEPGTKVEEVEN